MISSQQHNDSLWSQLHLSMLCGPVFFRSSAASKLRDLGLDVQLLTAVEALAESNVQVVVYEPAIAHFLDISSIKNRDFMFIAEDDQEVDADLFVPKGFTTKATIRNIQHGLQELIDNTEKDRINQAIQQKDTHIEKLTDLAMALSSEKNLSALLERILREGRKLGVCDAASLYLVEIKNDVRQLAIKLVQNASVEFPFQEQAMPLSDQSIAGYVANHGVEICVDDAYEIPGEAPFKFNTKFDRLTGYRCISLLAMPIKNHDDDVIGVLQFINKKSSLNVVLSNSELAKEHVISFDENTRRLLRGLASLSAIAIENKLLTENIKKLFDGFVHASVSAIEQRDPATSGHSFRVAELSLALSEKINVCRHGEFADTVFSENQLKELKYAALLHDFGKVGVREAVLTKANKLHDHRLELIKRNILLIKERKKRQFYEMLCHFSGRLTSTEIEHKRNRLHGELDQLDEFWQVILKANEPSVLAKTAPMQLKEILAAQFTDDEEPTLTILENEDFLALSILKGSLSDEERIEIQSHVVHTESFLRLIPWTRDLQGIPEIAGAHHEKLDGTGYPRGLKAKEIPLQAKIMTICDIYDALTAADRPYKPAVKNEKAFDILFNEAKNGYLDKELVRIFIESKVYESIVDKDYSQNHPKRPHFHHHVCDFDLIERD